MTRLVRQRKEVCQALLFVVHEHIRVGVVTPTRIRSAPLAAVLIHTKDGNASGDALLNSRHVLHHEVLGLLGHTPNMSAQTDKQNPTTD